MKPEAWLSSGPIPGPGRLLLVCHVSGFYAKPVRVMWVRGEQEQPGTQQGDIMLNADWTWYLSNPGCGGWGGSWPELLSEAQQSRRPGHHPVLG